VCNIPPPFSKTTFLSLTACLPEASKLRSCVFSALSTSCPRYLSFLFTSLAKGRRAGWNGRGYSQGKRMGRKRGGYAGAANGNARNNSPKTQHISHLRMPRQNCFSDWIQHCQFIKIWQRLYHSWSRFSKKLMISVAVSWNRKTNIVFINPQKTKVDQNCYIDLLKTSLLPECRGHWLCRGQWLWIPARECSGSHRAKVTQQFLRQNTPYFIAADEWVSYPLDLGYHAGFGVQRPTTSVCRTWKRQSKTNGRTVRKCIAQWEKRLNEVTGWFCMHKIG